MRPAGTSSSLPAQPGTPGRPRRRPDLSLLMPQRPDISSSRRPPPHHRLPGLRPTQHDGFATPDELERQGHMGNGCGTIAREIAIVRTAEHPAVVRCDDMCERGGELQILLEYMDGGSLDGCPIADEPFLAHVI
ncbi:hypothetical protein ZWY2020_013708 [Hordeum vulgare]|nr:hypothetical protein ZWY2020_013708 [Hordeum vulgare]